MSILFIYFHHYHDSKTLGFIYFVGLKKYTGSHWSMRPNVKFRVELSKKNPGLAKSHLQSHAATRKKTAPDKLLDIYRYKCGFHLLNLIYFIVSSKLWKSWFYCGMLMTFHIKFHLTYFFLCIYWLKRNILKKILPQVDTFLKLLRHILLLVKLCLSK